jgi:adenine-specific DNA-methyltransferase
VKGFVPTPAGLVDLMVERLFRGRAPSPEDKLLDPGCGDGAFLQGVIRWCTRNKRKPPRMVGIESEPGRATAARAALSHYAALEIRQEDFLAQPVEEFDFIVGNPPYVPITGLDEEEKRIFRIGYKTARGRFDLYLLFFEQGIKSLKSGGRLVFVTPEKFLYVETAKPLRRLLGGLQVEEILLVDEEVFRGFVTYPTVTTVINQASTHRTSVVFRDGRDVSCAVDDSGESWMPLIRGTAEQDGRQPVLQEICQRVSCGVATGADLVFVRKMDKLDGNLIPFAYPTIAGRELTRPGHLPPPRCAMLIPYNREGQLMEEAELGALGAYLSQLRVRRHLLGRTCVRRKPWYAFHETPLLKEMLKPKILCKDIGPAPSFWIDRGGGLVPRHSVYYIVPTETSLLHPLAEYLNSPKAARWLLANCQRAANGFVRLQSSVLKRLPVPSDFRPAVSREESIPRPARSGELPFPRLAGVIR